MLEINNKKIINAWASFDWANSVYALIVTTAIFPVYYLGTTEVAFGGDTLPFLGVEIKNSVLYSYAISFSYLCIVLISPVLSGIADYCGLKRRFMQFFTYLGSFSCIALYFFTGENIVFGILCSIFASIGFAGSLVFYNSFLPEIATKDRMDKVSAKGFAMGYIGSVILLVVNLILFQKFEYFGFDSALSATRFGFVLVGVWWLGFTQISFYHLKDVASFKPIHKGVLRKGFDEISKVFGELSKLKMMQRFLSSFFFFSMGVQTVLLLAPLFAKKEIKMGADEMILVVLLIQLIAVVGAYFFSWVSIRKGNKFSLSVSLIIWMLLCIAGYFLKDTLSFYVLAGFLGFVMGGIQSVSRSTYSKFIPNDSKDTASFFSFYDITEKAAIVLGTFVYGFIDQITGSMRYSILCMALFFIIAYIVMQRVSMQKKH